ncbi:MAG: hypothetical protein FWF25_02850, partial [Propionibacteriaceae bacterium]|nr:hypothetical protein [Propionibacteriaceae bacterium]
MTVFRIVVGGVLVHSSLPGLPKVGRPELDQEVNSGDTLEFVVPITHPAYASVLDGASVVVWHDQDPEPDMVGVVDSTVISTGAQLKVKCLGDLPAFLGKTIQPAWEVTGTPRDVLQRILDEHNRQVGPERRFGLGAVSADLDPNDLIVRAVAAHPRPSSWEVLKTRTFGSATGGFISVSGPPGNRMVSWLSSSGPRSDQEIRFGVNMSDFTRGVESAQFVTTIVPFGAELDPEADIPIGQDRPRVNVNGIPGASQLWTAVDGTPIWGVEDAALASSVGRHVESVVFDDIRNQALLVTRAGQELTKRKVLAVTIRSTAVDRHLVDASVTGFKVGAWHPVVVPALGYKDWLPIRRLKRVLDSGSSWVVDLAADKRASITDQMNSIADAVEKKLVRNVPGRPSGVESSSWVTFDQSGKPQGFVGLNWDEVRTTIDGKPATGVTYEVWGAPDDGSQLSMLVKTSEAVAVVSYLPVGTRWVFCVKALTGDGQSGMSARVIQVVAQDLIPPPVPDAPVVSTQLGAVTVAWTGLSHDKKPMPVDTDVVEVWLDGVNEPLTRFGRLSDVTVFADLPHGVEVRFRFRAIDTSGNKSGWSEWVPVTPVGVADTDLIGTMIAGQMSEAVSALQSLDQRLDNAETVVAQTTSDVAEAMRDVGVAKQDVAEAMVRVGQAQRDVDEALIQVNQGLVEVGQANADVAILRTTTIPRLQSDLDANRVDVQQAKTTAENAKASADLLEKVTIPALQFSLDDNTLKVIQAQTDVAKAVADIVNVNIVMSGLGSDLAGVSSDLAIAKTDVATLRSTTIPKLQTDLTANRTAVEKAQSSADEAKANVDQVSTVTIPALSKTLDDTALKVTQAQTDVTKATKDIVDVNSVVAGLGSDMAK